MTDFVSTWNEESFLTTPVAPLGLIAMRGTEDMGDKVNKWLLKWRKYTEETLPGDMSYCMLSFVKSSIDCISV